MKTEGYEDVTVVIPAFNAEAFIVRSIISALRQPEVSSVIVVDDNSSDGTIAAAKSSDDSSGRLMVVQQAENKGPGSARNRGYDLSSTSWVALLDADDYFMDGRLGRLLAEASEADYIADMPIVVNPGDEPPKLEFLGRGLGPYDLNLEDFILGNCGAPKGVLELGYLQPLMRSAFLKSQGISHAEDMRLGEDYHFMLRSLLAGARFRVLPTAGYVVQVTPGSLSRKHSAEDLLKLRDCDLFVDKYPTLKPEERRALRKRRNYVNGRLQWLVFAASIKQGKFFDAIKTFKNFEISMNIVYNSFVLAILLTRKRLEDSSER